MKWFGFGAGRAEARPALSASVSRTGVPIAGHGGGDWPRGYEARVRAAYLDNAVAQRAVRLVADGLAEAPLIASGSIWRAVRRASSARTRRSGWSTWSRACARRTGRARAS